MKDLKPKLINAFDPGKTTGYIAAEIIPGKSFRITGHGEFVTLKQFSDLVLLGFFKGLYACVCESYIVRPGTFSANVGAELYSAEVIGQVKLMAFAYSGLEVVQQSPSMAKQRWPDSRLIMHNVISKSSSMSEHLKDATRHLLTYVERNDLWNFSLSKRKE